MNKFLNETLRINRLLDFYGALLSKTQHEIMYDYYEANLSLSEIAENRNTSRTAVSDALKKGRKKLEHFEKLLNFCQVFDNFKNIDEEHKKIINELEEELKNGI